ncbi:hypothetical protein OAM78_03075 [Alphaproteobacteria bacterium]|nr:hypothetical protein [Alphaproteobacteria bacterium]
MRTKSTIYVLICLIFLPMYSASANFFTLEEVLVNEFNWDVSNLGLPGQTFQLAPGEDNPMVVIHPTKKSPKNANMRVNLCEVLTQGRKFRISSAGLSTDGLEGYHLKDRQNWIQSLNTSFTRFIVNNDLKNPKPDDFMSSIFSVDVCGLIAFGGVNQLGQETSFTYDILLLPMFFELQGKSGVNYQRLLAHKFTNTDTTFVSDDFQNFRSVVYAIRRPSAIAQGQVSACIVHFETRSNNEETEFWFGLLEQVRTLFEPSDLLASIHNSFMNDRYPGGSKVGDFSQEDKDKFKSIYRSARDTLPTDQCVGQTNSKVYRNIQILLWDAKLHSSESIKLLDILAPKYVFNLLPYLSKEQPRIYELLKPQ